MSSNLKSHWGAESIRHIAKSIRFRSKTVRIETPFSDEEPMELEPIDKGPHLEAISAYLYAHHYCGDPSLDGRRPYDLFVLLGQRVSDPSFLAALEQSNPGTGYFSPGWIVQSKATNGWWKVRRNQVTLDIHCERHLAPEEQDAALGGPVRVRFPSASRYGSPGYYVIHAEAGPCGGPGTSRIYLNIAANSAVRFTRHLLSSLASLRVPYTFKILSDPATYRRRDAAVVYVDSARLLLAVEQVLRVNREHPGALRDDVPSFTFKVMAGIAVADEPETIESGSVSFGQHRTRLIAEAVLQLQAGNPKASTEELVHAIGRRFCEHSIDPERPYLRRMGAEDYGASLHLLQTRGEKR